MVRVLLLVQLAAAAVFASVFGDREGLVWSEDFDGPVGSQPDPASWVYDLGAGGWGNQELQYYTDSPANVAIVADPQAEDGRALAISALREGDRYTSARIKTLGRFSVSRGYIEARVKVPRGRGIWPAFWLLGADIGTAGWPSCGEIDVLEVLGREPHVLYGTLHGPGYSGAKGISKSTRLQGDVSLSDGYHVVAIEWEPGRIRWFLDGELYHEIKEQDVAPNRWVFRDRPFFLLLNLAVGGLWPGYPDASTEFPQQYLIDYVRVYHRPPQLKARIGTYNVRLLLESDTAAGNGWERRRGEILRLLKFHQVEIVGLQEVVESQLRDLLADGRFAGVGVGRDDGVRAGEHAPILFAADRWECRDSGTFWLSETPEKPSFGWDATKFRRICTWARLRHRASGRELKVWNVHFDHEGTSARRESARLLLERSREDRKAGLPSILLGDFNCTPDSEPYRLLAKEWADARDVATEPPYGPQGTFNAFHFEGPFDARIDQIWVTANLEVLRHGTIADALDQRFPSDHFPVIVDVASH